MKFLGIWLLLLPVWLLLSCFELDHLRKTKPDVPIDEHHESAAKTVHIFATLTAIIELGIYLVWFA